MTHGQIEEIAALLIVFAFIIGLTLLRRYFRKLELKEKEIEQKIRRLNDTSDILRHPVRRTKHKP